jgi:CelD/BcsL family acetyltransferase involved in cellulose biosynthesis
MRGQVDVVAEDGHRDEVLASFGDWLAGGGWDVLHVVRPAHGSETPARLREWSDRHGWRYAGYRTARSTTYQLDLPATVDEWHRFFGAEAPRVLRRRSRRYAEFRGGRIEAAVPAAEVPRTLDALERLLAERWGEAEVYFRDDDSFSRLVHEAVPQMVERGSAWVSVAADDAGVQGVQISFGLNGTALAFMAAVTTDAAYRPFGLGKQLQDVTIEQAIDRGCRVYDLMPGGDYKKDVWHAVPRELEFAVVGRGLVGRLAAGFLARRRGAPI